MPSFVPVSLVINQERGREELLEAPPSAESADDDGCHKKSGNTFKPSFPLFCCLSSAYDLLCFPPLTLLLLLAVLLVPSSLLLSPYFISFPPDHNNR